MGIPDITVMTGFPRALLKVRPSTLIDTGAHISTEVFLR
jgi:hypothetical protein